MDKPDSLLYVVIIVLLCLSAFFSASETALSTVNRLRLRKRAEENDDKRAKAALHLTDHYDKSLSTILVGNNIVNIATSSIATVIATALFGGAGAAIATALVTVLVLVFGEILPKTYAGDNSEAVALRLARPLQAIAVVLTPLTWLFSGLKRLLYRLLPQPAKGPTVTEEELIYMIEQVEEEGVLEEQESDLVQSALQFDEIAVHEILTPRVNVVTLPVDSSVDKIRETVVEEGYARIPVYEDNVDNIIGILYSREFLNSYISGKPIDLRAMLGDPVFVHKRMKLNELLTTLKTEKTNIALVTDDYGGILGIVTMEDVLEKLVGDLWDEDDEIPAGIVQLDASTVEVAGAQRLTGMFDALGVTGPEAESDFATVNGWALHLFERIPKVLEFAEHGRFVLVVLEMNGHRIQRLRVSLRPETPKPQP